MDDEKHIQTDAYLEEGRLEALNKVRSATSVSMSPELFEKLYLSPHTPVKGELRQTFGNPTAIGIAGFVVCLTPLSIDLMGWRGAGGNGAATMGAYFFQGGLLLFVSGILEWVLGNTFTSVSFTVLGGFVWAFAATLNPAFSAYAMYAPPGEPAMAGLATTGFNASVAFWLLFMGFLCLIFTICALRTNIVFVAINLTLVIAFGLFSAAYILNADDFHGNAVRSSKLAVAAGATTFVTSWIGWYILTGLHFASVDFPIQLPMGDLSAYVKGYSETRKRA